MADGTSVVRVQAFRAHAQSVAEDLRRLAAAVERNIDDQSISMRDLAPDHSAVASDILHTVMWGLANLHLDGLVRKAAEADRAVRA